MPNPNQRNPATILPEISWDGIAPPYPDYRYFDGFDLYPFRHHATTFDMVNAWWLIEASTLSYSEEDFVTPRFQNAGLPEVKFFTGESTQCYVANNDKFVIVVFRGTEIRRRPGRSDYRNIIADLKTDLDFVLADSGQGGKAHRGVQKALDEVWKDDGLPDYIGSKATSGRTIWFTGHSLGATLAIVAADRYRNVQGLYTFGSPRVVDMDFKNHFHINTYRFVNNNDIFCRLMPAGLYHHVGELKHIDSKGLIRDELSCCERLTDAIRGEAVYLTNYLGRRRSCFGALVPGALICHVPTLYATYIWNNIPEWGGKILKLPVPQRISRGERCEEQFVLIPSWIHPIVIPSASDESGLAPFQEVSLRST
jgi:triacylglycerol lipase